MLSKLWSFFAEDNGAGSMSRLMAFTSLLASLFWVSYVLIKTHVIPDLHNPAYFVTSTNVPYALNLTHNGLTNIFGKNQGQ